ncbi:Exonuclease SbcC (plasmid) [Vibrio harveyi]|uniref:GspE/PulE family protein n=1 Tax=Vibrio harveyi TaxID=669 RepID=UPI001EFE745D|nr:ATPase, T2SS/T4P/T4SS family [Vibrio harveyi]ELY1990139.1 Flp pilus assembly complex ATPase component TadA [Vibrio harveyi]MCG9237408.1 Flp pilus assembly complex ATPase component TadA [Vibrio harveyi]MCG9590014.1 Flp pilus assembly complex ATPase component TadA [Vibrio harveyi]CAH1237685.1 Exonuclease SbcC [Vibrio harveyi]CAH1586954.1 Exonuclease SbcC [Vibrio harveyi]
MTNNAEVLINDELKSLYFNYQDTLLLADGTLLTSDYDSQAIEDVKTYIDAHKDEFTELLGISLRVEKVEQRTINNLIERLSSKDEGFQLDDETLSTIGSDAKKMLQEAVSRGASDIRIELYAQETRIRCRIDGRMVPLQKTIPEYEYGNHLIGYLFSELALDTDGDFYVNKPNNGRIEIDLSTPDGKRETIWRISYIYARNKGGQAVLRWLNKDTQIPKLDALGWESGHVKAMRDFMNSASGACLIAGQVGSGKSTTIASALNEVKDSGRSINTIEDPVEFDIGVIQTSVRGDNDELNGLVKLLLRHDVDIEMHGEMRSKEGAMAVCRKAETGQLMLTTLHTSSAMGIAHTMNEQMGVPLALIAAPNLMKLWIYQTLVRSVCPHCALTLEQAQPSWSQVQLEQYQQWLSHEVSTEELRFKNPEGCSHCYEGEKHRTTLVEMLVLDDEDRQFILRKEYLGWAVALKQKGYKTVLDHANLKIARGEIDLFTAAERVNGLFQKPTSSIYKTFF